MARNDQEWYFCQACFKPRPPERRPRAPNSANTMAKLIEMTVSSTVTMPPLAMYVHHCLMTVKLRIEGAVDEGPAYLYFH